MLTLESRGELLAELARLRKAFTDLIKVEPLGASTTQTLFLKRVCIRTSIPVTLSILYQVGGCKLLGSLTSRERPEYRLMRALFRSFYWLYVRIR